MFPIVNIVWVAIGVYTVKQSSPDKVGSGGLCVRPMEGLLLERPPRPVFAPPEVEQCSTEYRCSSATEAGWKVF